MNTNEDEIAQKTVHLPHSLIMDEILARLPVRSLCRFKAVSKLWFSMISGPGFAKSHLNNQLNSTRNSNSKWVFYQINESSWLLDYEAYDHQHKPKKCSYQLGESLCNAHLFGSSFGLLCFLVQKGEKICLSNPILRRSSRMISTPDAFVNQEHHIGGFGYVSSLDDFKIVLGAIDMFIMDLFFCTPHDVENGVIYVFSLKSGNWRTVKGGDELDILAISSPNWAGVLVDEHLHWWTTPMGKSEDGRIFAFDLAREMFREIPIPELLSSQVLSMADTTKSSGISVINGCLCLTVFWGAGSNMEIWIMKQYAVRDSWVRLYDLCVWPSYEYIHDEFFGFTRSSKLLIRCRKIRAVEEESVFLVDLSISPPEFELICCLDGNISQVVNYNESLISPFDFVTQTPQASKMYEGGVAVLNFRRSPSHVRVRL